jgi:hypothetical protein
VHIVNKVSCTYGGREVFSVDLGTGISANPYLVFFVRAEASGRAEGRVDRRRRGARQRLGQRECGLSALVAAFTAVSGIEYQSDAVKAMQADSFGNPGLLWVDRGAELWKQKCAAATASVAR